MRIACWITKATNTHSEHIITYCVSTATMVTRTHPNVTFIRALPVLFLSHHFFVSRCWCLCTFFSFRSIESLYCLDMGYRSVVQFPTWGKRRFLFHNVQSGSGAHSTFFFEGCWWLFPREDKSAGFWMWTLTFTRRLVLESVGLYFCSPLWRAKEQLYLHLYILFSGKVLKVWVKHSQALGWVRMNPSYVAAFDIRTVTAPSRAIKGSSVPTPATTL
jgi:hypothetical protein